MRLVNFSWMISGHKKTNRLQLAFSLQECTKMCGYDTIGVYENYTYGYTYIISSFPSNYQWFSLIYTHTHAPYHFTSCKVRHTRRLSLILYNFPLLCIKSGEKKQKSSKSGELFLTSSLVI